MFVLKNPSEWHLRGVLTCASLYAAALCYLTFIRALGGAKVSTFFVTSDIPISVAFQDTIAIKQSKSISLIRRIDWRALEARGCARGNRASAQSYLKKVENSSYYVSHVLARPFGARQSILLIKEMIFDYLIAILAQKAEKIPSLEILQNFKKF